MSNPWTYVVAQLTICSPEINARFDLFEFFLIGENAVAIAQSSKIERGKEKEEIYQQE